MVNPLLSYSIVRALIGVGVSAIVAVSAQAQELLPWKERSGEFEQSNSQSTGRPAPYGRQTRVQPSAPDPYAAPRPVDRYDYGQRQHTYRPPAASANGYGAPRQQQHQPAYPQAAPATARPHVQPRRAEQPTYHQRYGSNEQYKPRYDRSRYQYDRRYGSHDDGRRYPESRGRMPDGGHGTYSENELIDAGHRFFGSLSSGLAKAIQRVFRQSGRPNGYILGEDAGGAFVAGLRYGEGKLFTKHYGVHRVFWQGPSIGYDFGGDGNRTMTLVYNLRGPGDVYRRFGGVQGSAYLVGGVSVQLLQADDVTLAPIRTGVGLRLGANIGYLKFTRRPTWNPF